VSFEDGQGRGLLGLRERVAALGGDLDARRRLGGGFRVRAKIPVESP
jgi:signal transduction histidine kinase